MNQMTFSDMEYSGRKKVTQKEKFLRQMNQIIPWDEWVKKIQPHYPAGKRGRPPRGIEVMLRMYLLQIWFNLSDAGLEDAIYDSYAFQRFIGINFLEEQVPDATTLLKFRHLLEKHDLGKALFDDISAQLDKAGLMMHGGTIVDATIIHSTSSTKNKTGERDPEMHQTKKGNQWYHGMKVHIGVDAGTGYVHTIEGTAANVSDVSMTSKLVRKDDDNFGTTVPYWYALMEPVHGKRNRPEDFKTVNGLLFPNGTDALDIYEWTTDWSDLFDAGHEWYGSCCWTVYDKSEDRYIVMLVSATD